MDQTERSAGGNVPPQKNIGYLETCRNADLTGLYLTQEETIKTMEENRRILQWFDTLQELDTEGVEPLVQPVFSSENVLREDVEEKRDRILPEDWALLGAPDTQKGLFRVPRTI